MPSLSELDEENSSLASVRTEFILALILMAITVALATYMRTKPVEVNGDLLPSQTTLSL